MLGNAMSINVINGIGFNLHSLNKWNDLKWPKMTWNDLKWPEMSWNDLKWHEMTWNDMKWHVVIKLCLIP
jgi:hypothetical protein